MPVTTPIRNLIRDGQTVQIYNIMQTNRSQGMILLNDAINEQVQNQVISPEDAASYYINTTFSKTSRKPALNRDTFRNISGKHGEKLSVVVVLQAGSRPPNLTEPLR